MIDNLEQINRHKCRKRIKNLLALSKSPNQNEALAALEKARCLMREYALSESECIYAKERVKATKRRAKTLSRLPQKLHHAIFVTAAEMYRYLSKTILWKRK